MNSYQVDERIYAGEYARDLENPQPKIDALVRFGITHFIDLTEEGELIPYQQLLPARCTHLRFPIQDVSIPDDFQSVYELMQYIDKIHATPDTKIYIHCWGGVGRTGVIVGCYYVYHGEPYIKALTHLKESFKECPKSNRRRTPETWSQERFIKDFDHYKKEIETDTFNGKW